MGEGGKVRLMCVGVCGGYACGIGERLGVWVVL